MNDKLAEMLKEDFLSWRLEMEEIERKFVKGLITLEEFHELNLTNLKRTASSMFADIHQNCDW